MSPPARVPADWPQRAHSRSVWAGGLDWHVQVMGSGPTLLLLHGTGASAHSWAGLAPALATNYTLVMPDLPGHAFTLGARAADLSLPQMAVALTALLSAMQLPAPLAVVGHSAGAALALRFAVNTVSSAASGAATRLQKVLGFNPSLVAPPAAYMQWVAPLVNPVFTSAPMARVLAGLAARTRLIDRLLDSTGSTLPEPARVPYRRLFSDQNHLRGSLGFMAAADLAALLRDCAALPCETAFVLGQQDRWVPEPALRQVIQQHLPRAAVQCWLGGHLVHEVQPAAAAAWVLQQLTAGPAPFPTTSPPGTIVTGCVPSAALH
jgi:magnesium chelatase accessory protein